MSQASDEELLARQCALQEEAREVLAELGMATLVADIGPLLFAGSFVSGLMCWREIDAMVLVGGDFSPQDVLAPAPNLSGSGQWPRYLHRCVDDGVRTPRQFATWLAHHGLPAT